MEPGPEQINDWHHFIDYKHVMEYLNMKHY